MSESTPVDGSDRGARRPAWRRGLDPEERRRVLDAVALRSEDGWLFRFTVMLSLSIVVAVMGLSANSAAVVIGAMLLAPLMTPVMGAGAALAMALPRHLGRSLTVVLVTSVGAIALAYALAAILPEAPLTSEVLARTSPDLRDLIVALAAGAAGAYATIRPDVSSALPGVAVAVALVPPLAAVGVTLEAGRGDLVGGAVLLYAANLLAIIVVATMVFLITGFVPPRRLEAKGAHIASGVVAVVAATVAIAVPLGFASVAAAGAGRVRAELHAVALAWTAEMANELASVRVDGDTVRVSISGPTVPVDVADLESAVTNILGRDAKVEVRWTQTRYQTSETSETDRTTRVLVRGIVDDWLAAAGPFEFDIESIDIDDQEIRIDLFSAEPPPSVEVLAARLDEELGVSIPLVVNWTRRTSLRTDDSAAASNSLTAISRRLELAVEDWTEDRNDLVVNDLSFDGDVVVIDLLGPEPVETSELDRVIRRIAGPEVEIEVWLTRRERVPDS